MENYRDFDFRNETEKIIDLIVEYDAEILDLLQQKRQRLRHLLRLHQENRPYYKIQRGFERRIKRKYRRFWTSVKISQFWENDVPAFTDEEFKNTFRVNRTTFQYLLSELQQLRKSYRHLRNAISLEKFIGVALYALTSSVQYKTVAILFGIGRTTVGKIVIRVCKEICRVFHNVASDAYPPSDASIDLIICRFQRLGFPYAEQIDVVLEACCILNNICNSQNDPINNDWFVENVVEKQGIKRVIMDVVNSWSSAEIAAEKDRFHDDPGAKAPQVEAHESALEDMVS